jgi:hypothetical protein
LQYNYEIGLEAGLMRTADWMKKLS